MPNPYNLRSNEPVDLRDTAQNEAMQDLLSALQEFAVREEDTEMAGTCDELIELIQEHYVPRKPQVPYEVQVKQRRIEQLEATNRVLGRRIEQLEADVAQAIRTLNGT